MKHLIIILFVLLAFSANSQTVITDTLQGNETVNFTGMRGANQIQALCTQIGGTSDGTLILQGSVDGVSYLTVQETTNMFKSYPNDTLTITNGAIWLVDVQNNPFRYYRVVGGGTASDTTLITITWSK